MLKKGKIVVVSALSSILVSCTQTNSGKEQATAKLGKEKEVAVNILGKKAYDQLYIDLSDSVETWTLNRLGMNTFKKGEFEYLVDSLLCINKSGDRMLTCILMQTMSPNSLDGLLYLYGQKFNGQWYFCRGESMVIPRSMINNHDHSKPLNYGDLHQIALREFYSGYLDNEGHVNESWFTQYFENVGWCSACKTTEEFKQNFYVGAMAQWANRDTTQPIKRLDKSTKSLP